MGSFGSCPSSRNCFGIYTLQPSHSTQMCAFVPTTWWRISSRFLLDVRNNRKKFGEEWTASETRTSTRISDGLENLLQKVISHLPANSCPIVTVFPSHS